MLSNLLPLLSVRVQPSNEPGAPDPSNDCEYAANDGTDNSARDSRV